MCSPDCARGTVVDATSGTTDPDVRAATDAASGGGDLLLEALGSGSDYTPFLQHLGIATLSVEYGGEADQSGVYHSRYDTFDHYVRFGDPDFKYGVALAQTNGRLMLRVADALLLPQQAATVAQRIDGYVHQLHALTDTRRKHAADLTSMIDSHVYELASDPQRPLLAPKAEAAVPFLDLTALDNAVTRLTAAARAFDTAYAVQLSAGATLSAERARQINALLRGLERALTDARGLPGRSWYEPDLRPGIADRVWRQDAARCSRSDRAGAVADGRGLWAAHRRRTERLQRAAGPGDGFVATAKLKLKSLARRAAGRHGALHYTLGFMTAVPPFTRAPDAPALPATPLRFIGFFVREFRWWYLAMVLFETVNSTCGILIPYAMARIIRAVSADHAHGPLLLGPLRSPLIFFMALALIEVLASRAAGYCQVTVGPRHVTQ